VIVLNDGNVVDSGTSQEILIANSEIAVKSLMEPETEQCGTGQIIDNRKEICGGTTQEIQVQDKNDTKKPDFSRRDGSWQVYAYYVRSAGTLVACLFIASFIVSTFLSKFSSKSEYYSLFASFKGLKCLLLSYLDSMVVRFKCESAECQGWLLSRDIHRFHCFEHQLLRTWLLVSFVLTQRCFLLD
jgi:hypothetical protein